MRCKEETAAMVSIDTGLHVDWRHSASLPELSALTARDRQEVQARREILSGTREKWSGGKMWILRRCFPDQEID